MLELFHHRYCTTGSAAGRINGSDQESQERQLKPRPLSGPHGPSVIKPLSGRERGDR